MNMIMDGHICKDLREKPGDYIYEYCQCGAKWLLNRRPRHMDTQEARIEKRQIKKLKQILYNK
tara:strand:- start:593 stop:781 length:189 start_codon:yes stop_codon:yes gene_type:complete